MAKKDTDNQKYKVPALEKALSIVEAISDEREPIGVSELCKKLDIPKTSTFFILNTLEQRGYLIKNEEGKYELGKMFIHLGLKSLQKIDIRRIAKPFMNQLLDETGFTIHLAVLDQNEAMYIEKVENQAFVKFSAYIGQRLPLYASGVGKALASQLTPEQVDQICKTIAFVPKTENTITSPEELKENLELCRQQGYAVEDEEGEHGIRCIGSSIFDYSGKQVAAISITALRTELPVQQIPIIGDKVMRTAASISEQLGFVES